MSEDIKSFPKQFEFEPFIENKEKLLPAHKFIVAGMGGSNLATGIIQIVIPKIDMLIRRDYGLPDWPDTSFKNTLLIASSYSGNTEETVDAFHKAIAKNINTAVVTAGGELLKLARSQGIPYVQIPDTGIEPRSALGFSILSLLKLMGQEKAIKELKPLAKSLNASQAEQEGKDWAEKLKDSVPVIYSSLKNRDIAYNWKIRFNETGKVPSFINFFPELNHNEMNSFGAGKATDDLSKMFRFIFIKDGDSPRIKLRMGILKDLYEKKGLKVFEYTLKGKSEWEKIFFAIMVADWTAYYIATSNGLPTSEVAMVEDFKKELKKRGGEYESQSQKG